MKIYTVVHSPTFLFITHTSRIGFHMCNEDTPTLRAKTTTTITWGETSATEKQSLTSMGSCLGELKPNSDTKKRWMPNKSTRLVTKLKQLMAWVVVFKNKTWLLLDRFIYLQQVKEIGHPHAKLCLPKGRVGHCLYMLFGCYMLISSLQLAILIRLGSHHAHPVIAPSAKCCAAFEHSGEPPRPRDTYLS